MTDSVVDVKSEVKQASKEFKESENVAEKYSALTVCKKSEAGAGELSAAFTAVNTHKSLKKVRDASPRTGTHCRNTACVRNAEGSLKPDSPRQVCSPQCSV